MPPMAEKSGSRPPWVGLGAAVWLQVAGGVSSTFPLYSHALKIALGADQRTLAMLAVACDFGDSLGLLPGVLCNRLHPSLLLLVGAFACLVGYVVVWMAVSGVVAGIPYWLIWIALCVAANCGAWLATAVLVTNMRNFPLSRGAVAGILKGYSGLSAAVYTAIFTGILHNSATNLLLFLTLGVPVICLVMMYFVRPCTPSTEDNPTEDGHFLFTQIASVLLGVYLLSTTILDHALSLGDSVTYILLAVMIVLLLAPLGIPLKMTLFPATHKNASAIDPDSSSDCLPRNYQENASPPLPSSSSTALLGSLAEADKDEDVDILLAVGEGATMKDTRRRPRRGEDFRFHEVLVKADFWLLFVIYFIGVGSGVTILNNLAQVGIAAGVVDTTISLSLFSFCNFVGRLGGGAVSEYFVRSRTLPRTIWIACAQLIMVITYLLFALGYHATLYVSVALLGVCFGAQFSVMVSASSELFGLKHFGKIYNFITLGNPIGALLFNSLAGYVYDREVTKQNLGLFDSSSISCIGPDCFRLTFLVLAGVCVLGTLLSIVLTVRVKPVYHMLYQGGSFRMPLH